MSVRRGRNSFVPTTADPTPGTPFLRSDCDGQCAQVSGLSDATHHHHHQHHSHSHSHAPPPPSTTPLPPSTPTSHRNGPSSSASLPPKMLPPPYLATPSSTHRRPVRTTRPREPLPTQLTLAEVRKLTEWQQHQLESPERTDYTYSYSGAYRTKPPTPEWANPHMARPGLRGMTTRFVRANPMVAKSSFDDANSGEENGQFRLLFVPFDLFRQFFLTFFALICASTLHFSQSVSSALSNARSKILASNSSTAAMQNSVELSVRRENTESMMVEEEESRGVRRSGRISSGRQSRLKLKGGSREGLRKNGGGVCGSWWCCLLLLLLLLLPFLLLGFGRDNGREILTSFVVLIVNRTSEFRQNINIWQLLPSPPPSNNTTIIEKKEIVYVAGDVSKEDLNALRVAIEELRGRVLGLGEKCSKEPDLSNFVTQGQLNEMGETGTRLEALVASQGAHLEAEFKSESTLLLGTIKTQESEITELHSHLQILQATLAALSDKQEKLASLPPPQPLPTPPVVVSGGRGLSTEEVQRMVAAAILKYDMDKTGLPDFALEPAGGSVLSTRCSESYTPRTRKESFLGVPLWYMSYSPRVVIQPGVVPGECWAFKGSMGFLVIHLSGLIDVTHFSYEHIPKALSPDGHIDSAPKQFEVYGLDNEKDGEGVLLGRYLYKDDENPLQTFPVRYQSEPVSIIELRVKSNYGHPVYTCLYRFRVHGKKVTPAYGIEP